MVGMGIDEDINAAAQVISAGGIILYPTDTIWGIGCDATNENAIAKIYHLKKRDEKKSMIILLAERGEIEVYASNPSKKLLTALLNQRHPTTAIFERGINLPGQLINDDGTIAIRIADDQFCKLLLKKSGVPLVSTSANISGNDWPKTFREISSEIKNGVDYIVQHRQNDLNAYEPSSMIKLNSTGEIERLR